MHGRSRTAAGAVQLPERGVDRPLAVHGTEEQRSRIAAAVRLVTARGCIEAVEAELRGSQVEPYGAALGWEGRCGNDDRAAPAHTAPVVVLIWKIKYICFIGKTLEGPPA